MKSIRLTLRLCLASFSIFAVASFFSPIEAAHAAILCLESDGTTIKTSRKKRCTKRGGTVLTSITDVRGPQESSPVLCWAKVAADGTVQSFGGSATTSVSVSKGFGSGNYVVSCTGTYTGISGDEDVAYFASMLDTDFFNVASLSNESNVANETTLESNVFTWSSDGGNTETDSPFSFLVLGTLSS